VGDGALATLFPRVERGAPKVDLDELDGRVDEPAYRAAWGNWIGREEAFYVACAEIVAKLTWNDVRTLGGSELAVRERMAHTALDALTNAELPQRAKVAPLSIDSLGGETARVVGYSALDPLEMPGVLLAALACFDGGTIAEARERLAERHGLEVDDALIRKLLDFGLLTGEP
jgi:hypothetical protein